MEYGSLHIAFNTDNWRLARADHYRGVKSIDRRLISASPGIFVARS